MYLPAVIAAVQLFSLLSAQSISDQNRTDILRIPLQKQLKDRQLLTSLPEALNTKTGVINLNDFQDTYYFGPIEIGTPGQTIWVNFVTGDSNLWVSSSLMCPKYPHYCTRHTMYKHNLSKTYKKNGAAFRIDYTEGFTSGFISQDNMKIGNLEVRDQLFGEATDMDDQGLSDPKIKYDGIFGMAYPSLSQISQDTVLVNLVKQKAISYPVFAFYLNKNNPSESQPTAELVLGGVDPNHYTGDFVFAPVNTPLKFWNITIDGLYLNNQNIFGKYPAIISTGTTFLYGPTDAIDPILQALEPTPIGDRDEVHCRRTHRFPDINFAISGQKLVLKARDYIMRFTDKHGVTHCYAALKGINNLEYFILGDPFLRKYYTQFDMKKNRVGFAPAK